MTLAIFGPDEARWTRMDFAAIAGNGGIASVKPEHRDSCRRWLARHDYQVVTIDGARQIDRVENDLSRWLRFEELYGHPFHGNLDALNDAFGDIEICGAGLALEVLHVDAMWGQSEKLARGLLEIACDHSVRRIAVGERFFTVCVLRGDSPPIGTPLVTRHVPRCWGDDYRGGDPFERPDGQ